MSPAGRFSTWSCLMKIVAAVFWGAQAIAVLSADESPVTSATGSEAASETSAPQQFLLKYNFPVGALAYYEVRHKSAIEVRHGDVVQTTYNESQTYKHYRVTGKNGEGHAIIEPVIDSVRMTARADDDEPVVFDSAADAEQCPPQFRRILETIGRPLARVAFSENGELMSLEPLAQVVQASAISGDKGTADASQNFLVVLPDHPVALGDMWSDEIAVVVSEGNARLAKTIALKRQYCLKSVEGKLATISFKTAVVTPITDPAIQAQLIQRAPEGTVVFDLDSGMLISFESTVDSVVVGPFGARTSLHAVARRKEHLVVKPEDGERAKASAASGAVKD